MVVDDQPGIRRLLTEILTEHGYKVATAANGYEGLQKAKELKPALVLMDMKMPGMDGIETLREMKSQGQGGDKVIMMTAYGELDMVEEAKSIGAHAYIVKPFDINILCKMIEESIADTEGKDELRVG